MSTSNSAVYGELGRYPLYITRFVRISKYFINLYTTKQNNVILYHTLNCLRYNAENIQGCDNWVAKVRDMLQSTGFNDVWLYPNSVNIKIFTPIFRNRLVDLYIGTWRIDIRQRSSLSLFKELKINLEMKCHLT